MFVFSHKNILKIWLPHELNIELTNWLSTVKNADRIYTVDSGEILGAGTHQELLDEKGGMRNCIRSNRKHDYANYKLTGSAI